MFEIATQGCGVGGRRASRTGPAVQYPEESLDFRPQVAGDPDQQRSGRDLDHHRQRLAAPCLPRFLKELGEALRIDVTRLPGAQYRAMGAFLGGDVTRLEKFEVASEPLPRETVDHHRPGALIGDESTRLLELPE